MDYGARLRKRRKELKISADDLAEKIGKNRATIYRYESGEIGKLPLDALEPLAVALQTSTAYLMGITDNPSAFTSSTNMSIGAKIAQRQQALDVPDFVLMKESGLSQEALEAVKNGDSSKITFSQICKIAKVFKVDASFFFTSPSMVSDVPANIKALLDINDISEFNFDEAVGADIDDPTSVDLELIADFFGVDLEDLLYKDYRYMQKNAYHRARVRALRTVKSFFEDLER